MLNLSHFAIIRHTGLRNRDIFRRNGTIGKNIIQRIVDSAETYLAPDGKKYPVISLKAVNSIARSEGVSVIEVQVTSLKQGIVPWRYLRNIGTIGMDGQIKLLQATVAIVGAGGLGGTIIELLARQGLGHLIIVDNDRFAEQDLNRQLLSTEKNLGKYKATVAASRVKEINPVVIVTTRREKLTKENATTLLKSAEVVVDGLDNLSSRFAVAEACRNLKIPFVYGTIAGFNGQLMTIFPEDAGLTSIYGSPDSCPEQGVEVRIGNPSATPAMVAAWQVQEVIKIITGTGKLLRNHILMLDALENVVDEIELKK